MESVGPSSRLPRGWRKSAARILDCVSTRPRYGIVETAAVAFRLSPLKRSGRSLGKRVSLISGLDVVMLDKVGTTG